MTYAETENITPPALPRKDTSLQGLKEISGYARVSENTVLKYVKYFGFPAGKLGGQWVSDKVEVDEWRRQWCARR